MHPPRIREQALRLRAQGVPFGEICKVLAISRNTAGHWFYGDRARRRAELDAEPSRCPRCARPPRAPDDQAAYAYLLGLYLGDGHLVTKARVPVLRVFCADAWPGLIDECEIAMLAVIARKVQRVQKQGCIGVQAYSKHWPCLLPQHGPGHKHHRPILLADWQAPIMSRHAGQLLRGLFHSDGCRVTNRIKRGNKCYAYPRYNFSNESRDIMGLCQKSLDRLGVEWRMCRPNMLSVARREAVARLDEFVGPKW
ncbi:helix-turn-helix domain-containing protein [Paractinoplanes globisporus]|uniref:Helix-turn-helix domain-containing protein n=1 Tax=Paractinoplanes globisporus TaxID=113565 RepID=A0ABW6WGC4_9ACTN|nr:helix-turn-helix domain-containing protein [Actinoplanes globisporus]